MSPHKKETTSGGMVLAAIFIGGFIILFAAPLLFLLSHMS
jgi:hypothetical protein